MERWTAIDVDDDPLELLRTGHDPALVIDAWSELRALVKRPWWHQHAACRGDGPARWWPGRGEDIEPLRAVCAGCPVREECQDVALARPSHADGGGVWGGTSERQRRTLRKSTSADTAA